MTARRSRTWSDSYAWRHGFILPPRSVWFFRVGFEFVEVVSPRRHHASAFLGVFGMDVSGSHLTAFGVCHLALDNVPAKRNSRRAVAVNP